MLLSLSLFCLFSLLSGWMLKRLFPVSWGRFGRRLFWAGFLSGLLGIALWMLGFFLPIPELIRRTGVTIGAAMLVASLVLTLTLPLWGPLGWFAKRWQAKASAPINTSRRQFLSTTAGVVPVIASATGPAGALNSMQDPVLTPVEISSLHVPEALEGLKILQITDVHLGPFINPSQVESVVEKAREHKPDLIVLTGDLADDLKKLPKALEALNSLKAPLGIYACIGNHEIYRGREEAERILQEAGVIYLRSEGRLITYKGAQLFIAGADDPGRMGDDHRAFFEETVSASFSACPPEVTCRILLSHRPDGFEAGVKHNATLTLSGHTHGGQVALFGRSIFEGSLGSYLLGTYTIGESALYTSAGLGHWFPFRVNCPCEAPLITLSRSSKNS